VLGVTDTWWRGKDSLISVYCGEAVGMDAPTCLEAHVYSGLEGVSTAADRAFPDLSTQWAVRAD
jgi:hypothetical protein